MASIDVGGASPQKELTTLRRRRWSIFRSALFTVIIAVSLVIIFAAVRGTLRNDAGFYEARNQLLATGSRAPWTEDFISRQEYYNEWLVNHGTELEADLFNRISQFLFTTAAMVDRGAGNRQGEDPVGFVTGVYISVNFALMRIAFIIIASWRLWIAAVVIAWLYGVRAIRPYSGGDALGETGNNRLFFSGAYAGLKQITPAGAPAVHVTGLACVPQMPLHEVAATPVGQVLTQFGITSPTAKHLAATIGKHPRWPCYVAGVDESAVLSEVFDGVSLPEGSALVLRKALELHTFYRESGHEGAPPFLKEVSVPVGTKITAPVYADLLQSALHRVLTPAMREELAKQPPAVIATAVLAYEAGKVMAYRFETNRWIRKSIFPQLCARSVLHSQNTFGKEFNFAERSMMRRALVFGSRQSVFAPVRFPIDFTLPERALRQWIELLIAGPHSLQSTADEVELFGLVCQTHEGFLGRFMKGAAELHTIPEDIFASPSNVFFMPVQRVLHTFRQVVTASTIKRMEELVALVSQRQRIQQMSQDLQNENGERMSLLQSFERVFPPLSHAQMKTLSELHGLTPTDLREWSTMRVVLNAFGWLGRRVGDYSVPESSIIFTVFRVEPGTPGANSSNFLGKKGMVALRATRLVDSWGRGWRSRYQNVIHASMAETAEDYEKRLRGEDEPLPSLQELGDIGTVNL